MKGVLVYGAGDDGVDLTGEREAHGFLDRLTGDLPGCFRREGAGSGLLVAEHGDVRVQRPERERFGHQLRPDSPRVAGRHGEAGRGGGGPAAVDWRRRDARGAAPGAAVW